MRFVPVLYESADEFISCRWSSGGEGVTVLGDTSELPLGEDVLLEIKVRGTPEQAVVRGTVIWKREREDAHHNLPTGAGVKFHERDLDRVTELTTRLRGVHQSP